MTHRYIFKLFHRGNNSNAKELSVEVHILHQISDQFQIQKIKQWQQNHISDNSLIGWVTQHRREDVENDNDDISAMIESSVFQHWPRFYLCLIHAFKIYQQCKLKKSILYISFRI